MQTYAFYDPFRHWVKIGRSVDARKRMRALRAASGAEPMSFPLDDIYPGVGVPGVPHPATFGQRKGHEGIIFHTTEGAGPTRAHAMGTARFQLTHPGSYNFIIYDGGVLLTVPYLEAAGGVNPASRSWAPGRYPWLRQLLSPEAYRDPNAYHLNVAFSGRAVDLSAGRYSDNMIDTAARLVLWFETTFAVNAILSGHNNWQSNRSDPGPGVVDKILALYGDVTKPPAPPPLSREERLAQEVIALRATYPEWAAEWVRNTGMTQDVDGQPLQREMRLAAEVTFLRKAAA